MIKSHPSPSVLGTDLTATERKDIAGSAASSSVSSADSVDPDSPGVDSAISSAYLTSNSATETDDGTESGKQMIQQLIYLL